MISNKTIWILIGVGVVLISGRELTKIADHAAPSPAPVVSSRPAICSTISAESDRAIMDAIYKIDRGYEVYVESDWYALKIDEKEMFAGYVARCKLGGSARFLDSRTGKLLARWGANGYVNYQE